MKTWDFIGEFMKALQVQLESDDVRWGDTWLRRTRIGQEGRTIKTFKDYFDQYESTGAPIPWLKIAGAALICWVREQHPEIWPD